MLKYTYRIIEKYGFKHIDTSQYYGHTEYYELGDIELLYEPIQHKLVFNYFLERRVSVFHFNEQSTDSELDSILKTELRLNKIKKLLK